MLGPSVKSRIVLILPRIGTVSTADELSLRSMLTPILLLPVAELKPAASNIGDNGWLEVPFTSSIPRLPLTPFWGAKNATAKID